jgi:integrase
MSGTSPSRACRGGGDDDHIALFLFMLLSGLRQEEALLRWPQVDFGRKKIVKTGKGGEVIYKTMTPDIERILRSRIGHHPTDVFTYTAKVHRRSHQLFGKTMPTIVKGRRYPITAEGFRSWWNDRRRAATKECPSLVSADRKTSFRLHDSRHTYASNLLRKSKNLKAVKEELGHANIATTMKYAHVDDEDRRIATAEAESGWLESLSGQTGSARAEQALA